MSMMLVQRGLVKMVLLALTMARDTSAYVQMDMKERTVMSTLMTVPEETALLPPLALI